MRPVLLQLGLIGGIGTYGVHSKEMAVVKNKEQEQELAQLLNQQGGGIDITKVINV